MADDPYQVLGVARDAAPEAFKKAYRKLARAHHPDLNPGKPAAEARFKAVSAAHEILSDHDKRARFDRGEIDGAGTEQAPAGGYRREAEQPGGTGRQIRLRGKGVAAQGARAAGDLLLTLRVVIGPPDAALEAFLRDWVPEQPLDPRAGLEEGR